MKKILLSILSIFFCLGMLTGGAIMLSGCNSSSYSENNPLEEKPEGGFDDSQNENDNEEHQNEDMNDNAVSGYTAKVSFNSNCSSTVTGMPSTVSVSREIVATNPEGYWNLGVTIPSNIPKRSGNYTFTEWNALASGSGSSYSPGDTIYVSGKKPATTAIDTLYAQWKYTPYTITFNSNGCPNGTMDPIKKASGESVQLTPNCFWWGNDDYQFVGWATSSNSGTVAYENYGWYSDNRSITLYAIWDYKIRFDGNGATSGSMSTQTKRHARSLKLNANNYKRTGYTFLGWSLTPTGSVQYNDGAYYSTNDIATLYAVWGGPCTITYDGNGATGGSTPSTTVNYGDDAIIAENGFIKEADEGFGSKFEFRCWATSSSGEGSVYHPGDTIELTSDITLYAIWDPVLRIVVGGNGSSEYITDETDFNVTSNHGTLTSNFLEWSSNWDAVRLIPEEGITEYIVTISVTNTEHNYRLEIDGDSENSSLNTITYTWTADDCVTIFVIPYQSLSITLDGNGGTRNGSTSVDLTGFMPGEGMSLSPFKFEKTGYTHIGFSKSKNATSASFTITFDEDNATYYAIYEPNAYKNIYYYRNQNYELVTKEQTRYFGESFNLLDADDFPDMYNSYGWELGGFGTVSNRTTIDFSAGESVLLETAGDEYYYAISTRTLTLNYNANGGSFTTTPGPEYGEQNWNHYGPIEATSFTLTTTEPTRTGYDFLGWSKSSTATKPEYEGGSKEYIYSPSRETPTITLYAVWEGAAYVNYYRYRNTSDLTARVSQIRTYGQSFTTLTTSSIDEYDSNGWSLYGWATSSSSTIKTYSAGESVTSTTYINSTSTLYWYAISSRTVSLAYNANGGSFSATPTGDTDTQYWNQWETYRTSPTLTVTSTIPTRTGYNFLGWSTSLSATTANYDPSDSYTFSRSYNYPASITLYAVWERSSYQLTINYYSCSATNRPTLKVSATRGTLSSTSLSYGGKVTLTSSGEKLYHYISVSENTSYTYYIGTTSSPSYTSYSDNWWPDSDSTINIYVVQRYTITYNGNGGTTSSGESTTYGYKRHGTAYNIAKNPFDRANYVFTGWNPYANGSGTNSPEGEPYTGNANRTLYAQWDRISLTISFNPNGGEGTMSPQSKSSGIDITLKLNTFTRDGYDFVGWAKFPNGSVEYTDGDTFQENESVTLYAVWRANNPAHYDSVGGYWYIENGKMPQSRVADDLKTTLNSKWSTLIDSENEYYFAGTTLVSKIYESNEYCKYEDDYYLVEPIRWRLVYSSSQVSGYGTTTDTLAVMAEIVYVDAFSDSYIGAGPGYSSESVTELMKNQLDVEYLVTESKSMPTFGSTSLNGTPTSVSSNIFVASYDELSNFTTNKNGTEKLGKIKFSDLAKDYLRANGKDTLYYTRDLGKTHNHIWCMNANGDRVQYKAQNYFGVQFAVKVTEYACV